MALNSDVLGQSIANLIIDPDAPQAERTRIENLWKQIAGVIVDHIKTYGQVNVTNVSGVTPGSGLSGPGTGTIV